MTFLEAFAIIYYIMLNYPISCNSVLPFIFIFIIVFLAFIHLFSRFIIYCLVQFILKYILSISYLQFSSVGSFLRSYLYKYVYDKP